MDPRTLIDIMRTTGKLKDMTRHSWTAQGRRESVAEHTYQMMIMAYFIQDEFPQADMKRVMEMCLFHDMGEAFTGDIPAFEKKPEDEETERQKVQSWIDTFPGQYRQKVRDLFDEMEAHETLESRIYKALDKLEVVIQHNEADLSTWLPLEYTLNLEYGDQYVEFSEFMKEVRRLAKEDSEEKIKTEKDKKEQ